MKSALIILIFLFASLVSAQNTITWKDLECEYTELWSDKYNAVYKVPQFDKEIVALDSTLIRIKGLVTPIDPKAELYFLTKVRMNFGGCAGGQMEGEIIEVRFKKDQRKTDFSKEFLIEGVLVLNKVDITQMVYILENAIIIE